MGTFDIKKTYRAKGIVFGEYWGGGAGSYPATTIEADTIEKLLNEAKQKLDNGSLDSGMGFQSLIGALLPIETISTIEIDGKTFTNIEIDLDFVGDLSESQQEFLLDVYYH